MKLSSAVALCLATVVAGLLLYPAAHLRAQKIPAIPVPFPSFNTFGMVGVTQGQSARLNALLLPTGGPILAGSSCQVTFTFLDDQGATLASATMPVNQNQAVHFDYPALPAAGARMEIRGTVQTSFVNMSASPVAFGGFCIVVPSMEVFNSTNGQTLLWLDTVHPYPAVLPLVEGL